MNAHDGAMGGERRGGLREGFGVRRLPVAPAELLPNPPPPDGDEALRAAVERAQRLSADLEEPFRSLAFSGLLAHLLRSAPAEDDGERAPVEAPPPPSTDMPIAEFLALRRIDSHPDRVVAIAYYHYHRSDEKGGQGVTTKDLLDAYVRARAKRPQNYPDVIASCVRKGYLVEGSRRDGMKSWVITRTGETHVEQDL